MFKEDFSELENNPLGFFVFDKRKIRVVIYTVRNLHEEEAIGFIHAFSDINKEVGGIIKNSLPAMNSSIARGYDSQDKLWTNFKRVRQMTLNRPNFDLLWEGVMNYGWIRQYK